MMGRLHSSSFSLACNSRPDIFGMRMSTIKHAAVQCKSDLRNSSADPKLRAASPAASKRSRRESCIASSSSMMAINLEVWSGGMPESSVMALLEQSIFWRAKLDFSRLDRYFRWIGDAMLTGGTQRLSRPELVCHPDKLRQGFRLHLFHDLAAIHFDGRFAGTEFRCSLLVKHSGDDQFHYFAFTNAESFTTMSQFS